MKPLFAILLLLAICKVSAQAPTVESFFKMAECKNRTQFDSLMQTLNYVFKEQMDNETTDPNALNIYIYYPNIVDSVRAQQNYIFYQTGFKKHFEYSTKNKRNYQKLLKGIKKLGYRLQNSSESLMCVISTTYYYTSTKHTRYKVNVTHYKEFNEYTFTVITQ